MLLLLRIKFTSDMNNLQTDVIPVSDNFPAVHPWSTPPILVKGTLRDGVVKIEYVIADPESAHFFLPARAFLGLRIDFLFVWMLLS